MCLLGLAEFTHNTHNKRTFNFKNEKKVKSYNKDSREDRLKRRPK